MWLVLFFQTWYVADGLYNEVRPSHTSSHLTHMSSARYSHYHGYYDGWFRVHAFHRRSHLGPFCLLTPGPLLSLQPRRTWVRLHCVRLPRPRAGLLHLPHSKRRKERFPQRPQPQKYVSTLLFRIHPNMVADLEFFVTESGSKLLTSGWWGRSRHPNYLYDRRHFYNVYSNVVHVAAIS